MIRVVVANDWTDSKPYDNQPDFHLVASADKIDTTNFTQPRPKADVQNEVKPISAASKWAPNGHQTPPLINRTAT